MAAATLITLPVVLAAILKQPAHRPKKSAVHGPEDISPVGMAAALHLGNSVGPIRRF
jgi:hypothetical protein